MEVCPAFPGASTHPGCALELDHPGAAVLFPGGHPVCAVWAGLTDLSFGVDLPGFSTVKLSLPFCD